MPYRRRELEGNAVYHLTQRGTNRMPVFHWDHDRLHYLALLEETSTRMECRIHAYCLMSNHVHLLVSAEDALNLPRMMSRLQGMYARWFNLTRHRSGSLWERRFHSTHVESEAHLHSSFHYLDHNPVRGRICTRADQYEWSSHRVHAFGQDSSLIQLHDCYLDLASTAEERRNRYQTQSQQYLEAWRQLVANS